MYYAKLRQERARHRVPRRRRRPGHRLRRLALDVPLVDELLRRGVRARHRLQHHRRLRRREGAASEHRLGVGPGDRRAPLGARGRGLRRDREDAAGRRASSRPPDHKLVARADRHRREPLAGDLQSSPGTTCSRSRRRRRRCSSSACSSWTSRRASRRCSGRSPNGCSRWCARWIRRKCRRTSRNLKIELADQHICNFSVFQSLLDHWALGAALPDRADPPAQRAAAARSRRWSTSPATRTARSRSSSISTTCATRCRSTTSGRRSRTTWASS